jgi:NADPH-dependent 2,4-dienoyl-CoA reductase/sulfur reductase-like enzyme
MHFEETKRYLQMLDGMFDIVNVSAGLHTDIKYFKYWSPGLYMGKNVNVKYAAELKRILNSKVSAVAGIMNIGDAEKIISEGQADFCAMARPLMADPEMPGKYARNKPEDVRPCTRCNYCGRRISTLKTVACAVNPHLGREAELDNGEVRAAHKKKTVAVVGGGPGGMQAALTLRARGHEVILFEKEEELGGNLIAASDTELKPYMLPYLTYMRARIRASGTHIKAGTTATAETIEALRPDALIIAVGADPVFPPVTGIDLPHVHWAADADLGKCGTGDDIVIIGAGSVGLECAVKQSNKGKRVLVLEMLPFIPPGASFGEEILVSRLEANGGSVLTSSSLSAIYADHVVVTDIETGNTSQYPCDTVLIAAGLKPRRAVVDELCHTIAETDVFIIGDALRSGMIGDAVRSGFDAALSI